MSEHYRRFLGNELLTKITKWVMCSTFPTCCSLAALRATRMMLLATSEFAYKNLLRNLFISAILLATCIEAQAIEPPRWKSLDFVTSILFFSAESHLEIMDTEPSLVLPKFEKTGYGEPALARAKKVKHMVLTSSFLGKYSDISLYFDSNLNTFQRTQLNSGKKHRYKAYYFLDSGVYSFSQTPTAGQEMLHYTDWSNKGDDYFQYPVELDLTKPIIDSTHLFYIVSSELFTKPGDKASFNLFVKNRLLSLDVVAEEVTEIEVDYLQVMDGRKEYIEEEVDVLRIAVKPRIFNPARPNHTAQIREFKFLGLKSNLQFYVDTKKRLLVQLSGRIDVVGIVDIVLNKVEFK